MKFVNCLFLIVFSAAGHVDKASAGLPMAWRETGVLFDPDDEHDGIVPLGTAGGASASMVMSADLQLMNHQICQPACRRAECLSGVAAADYGAKSDPPITAVILSPFRISPGQEVVLRLRHVADVMFWARLRGQKRSDKGIDAGHVGDIASGASWTPLKITCPLRSSKGP
jgi:hypothetical protein